MFNPRTKIIQTRTSCRSHRCQDQVFLAATDDVETFHRIGAATKLCAFALKHLSFANHPQCYNAQAHLVDGLRVRQHNCEILSELE